MSHRRVVLTFSVARTTSREKLANVPTLIRTVVESYPDVRFDRSHFAKIGATSFDFETVYTVNTSDYNRHMDILQDLQLRVLEGFEQAGIDLAEQAQILRV
jgi:small-conductance mechanosensitive channel